MLYLETSGLGDYDSIFSYIASQEPDSLNLRPISTRSYKLVKALDDLFSGYIPIIFDETHYSLLNLTLHAIVFEFRIRQMPMNSHCAGENIDDTEPVIKIEFLKEDREQITYEVKRNVGIIGYFFGDLEGNLPKLLSKSDVDEVYEDYIMALLRVQGKLNAKIIDLGEKTLSEENFKELERKLNEISKHEVVIKCEVLTPEAVSSELIMNMNNITGNILQIWHMYIELIEKSPKEIMIKLSDEYSRMLNETFSYFIFHRDIDITDKGKYKNSAAKHDLKSKELHNSDFFNTLRALPIQDQVIFDKIENIPLVFEDLYESTKKSELVNFTKTHSMKDLKKSQMLFVLVHGFQASSCDMKFIKNHFLLFYPNAQFLCSSYNERKTEGDIQIMGLNLAKEIRNHIKFNGLIRLGKISFIGHSRSERAPSSERVYVIV